MVVSISRIQGGVQKIRGTLAQVAVQPGDAFRLGNTGQRPPQDVFGYGLASQEAGIDAIAAHGGHMGVALVVREDGEHPGAQHIGQPRGEEAGTTRLFRRRGRTHLAGNHPPGCPGLAPRSRQPVPTP